MNSQNYFHRLFHRFTTKPAPRRGWQAPIVLEALEIRLNLSAVLIVETVDAYFVYDDADALLNAASGEQTTGSSVDSSGSDFTPQELKVIDGLVAELIASEGYSDNDILSINYFDNTTSDELIASGFFDDASFNEDNATQATTSVNASTATTGTAVTPVTLDTKSSNLPRSADADAISPRVFDAVGTTNAPLSDASNALVPQAVLPAIDSNRATALVNPVVSAIFDAQVHSDLDEATSASVNQEEVPDQRPSSPEGKEATTESAVLSAVSQVASASEFLLPFATFPVTKLTTAGVLSGLDYSTSFWSSRKTPSADDASNLETEETQQVSYSQIAAAIGTGGLAVARWLHAHRTIENVSPVNQLRQRVRRSRQTSL